MAKIAVRILPLLVLISGCASTALPEMSEVELPSDVPFRGANVILVEMDGDPDAMRTRIVQTLRAENYDISQTTLNESTIETEPRVVGTSSNGTVRYFIDVPQNAGERVRIYGTMIQQIVEDRTSYMRYPSQAVMPGGERLSLAWDAWRGMNSVANIMGSGDPLYDRD